jgi:dTDP-D-glucose 4,6-dehydratase
MEFINDNIIGTANLLEYARRLEKLETLYLQQNELLNLEMFSFVGLK